MCYLHTGRKVVGGLGGGYQKEYTWVDNVRQGPKEGPPLVEKILKIQSDPCRSAKVALVAGGDKVRYIIASSSMKEGDLISTSGHIPRIASMSFNNSSLSCSFHNFGNNLSIVLFVSFLKLHVCFINMFAYVSNIMHYQFF